MGNKKFLAIDLGASSGRGIVGEYSGGKLTLTEIHRFSNDPVYVNGSYQWDILRIFHEIKAAIRKCALDEKYRDIESIGIDTWGVDFGLLDESGKLMENPHHYRDTRVDGMFEAAYKRMPKDEIYRRTGLQFLDFNTVYQLLSLVEKRPHVLRYAKDLLMIPDLLNYFLTGVKKTEYTIASTSQMLNAQKGNWDWELIDAMSIPRSLLGEITPPGTVVGNLTEKVLEETGNISARVVTVGGHDTASAVAAVPAEGEDIMYISSGTWSLMGIQSNEPIINDQTFADDFTNEGGISNTIRFLKNIMGLWIEQESKRQWEREGDTTTYNQLSDMAAACTPCVSIINPDDSLFERPGDMPSRIREYCKRTGQPVPQTKGEIVRCIFDSLALKYRTVAEQLDNLKGKRFPAINIVGGGTKEGLLCQITADATGRTVYAGPVEATAIGNIVVQLMASGEIATLSQGREIIRNSFEIVEYKPNPTVNWDEAYDRFQKLVTGK